jgi:hypothetical protein
MTAGPELSIVLPTGHGWRDAEPTLRALLDPPGAIDFELLLCDGGGIDEPCPYAGDPRLTQIEAPGESVFALRALGIGRARGRIVAITEDHCIPEPDWPAALVAAHARHPEAAALAGAVANGSTEDPWDWANFLLTFAEHMRPIDGGGARRAPSVANGSIKRERVDLPGTPHPGWLELELMPALVEAGQVVRDDGPLVTHVQSHGGIGGTLAAHFHNGRACTGLRADPPGPRAVAAEARRLAGLPWRLLGELRAARSLRPPLADEVAAGARRVPFVALAHTAGEATGLLAGPGRSAELLD